MKNSVIASFLPPKHICKSLLPLSKSLNEYLRSSSNLWKPIFYRYFSRLPKLASENQNSNPNGQQNNCELPAAQDKQNNESAISNWYNCIKQKFEQESQFFSSSRNEWYSINVDDEDGDVEHKLLLVKAIQDIPLLNFKYSNISKNYCYKTREGRSLQTKNYDILLCTC